MEEEEEEEEEEEDEEEDEGGEGGWGGAEGGGGGGEEEGSGGAEVDEVEGRAGKSEIGGLCRTSDLDWESVWLALIGTADGEGITGASFLFSRSPLISCRSSWTRKRVVALSLFT